jgi:hypothetical protein
LRGDILIILAFATISMLHSFIRACSRGPSFGARELLLFLSVQGLGAFA